MTQKIELTEIPQLIGAQLYAQSEGGEFNYSFGASANPDIGYSGTEINYDGTFGQMWAWKSVTTKVILKFDVL